MEEKHVWSAQISQRTLPTKAGEETSPEHSNCEWMSKRRAILSAGFIILIYVAQMQNILQAMLDIWATWWETSSAFRYIAINIFQFL